MHQLLDFLSLLICSTSHFNPTPYPTTLQCSHLDHCGALPHFTEILGYRGPIVMTHPTRAICPVLLDDYRKLMSDKLGPNNFFTAEHIKACMEKGK